MKTVNSRGSALVISLIMIVLVTILVLGFVTTARLDRASARLHLNGVQADIYCQMGEEVALARLTAATTETYEVEEPYTNKPTKINRSWISQPGRLIVSPPGAVSPVETVVDLTSGTLDSNDASYSDSNCTVNLNPKSLEDPSQGPVAAATASGGTPPEMRVRWMYVRQDGTCVSALPAFDALNPVKGRFAFWTDDYSTRINLNTAWTEDSTANTSSFSHPSRVDLGVLLSLNNVTALHERRQNQFFNSAEEAKAVNPDVASMVNRKKFSVTHYNHSPELNMFGEPRIMLTTQKSLAGDSPFLDILAADNLDPGPIANLSRYDPVTKAPSKIDGVVRRISDYLRRTDWPIKPGTSFADKYTPRNYPGQIDQLALDIIEYVRSRESRSEALTGITGAWNNQRFKTTDSLTSEGDYQGNTRRPYITEIGVWEKNGSVSTSATVNGTVVKAEVWLPPGCAPIDLTKVTFWTAVGFSPDLIYKALVPNGYTGGFGGTNPKIKPGPPPANNTNALDLQAYLDSPSPMLQPGGYRVITAFQNRGGRSGSPMILTVRIKVCGSFAAVQNDNFTNLNYRVDSVLDPLTGQARTPDQVTSISVADPMAGKQNLAWGTPPEGTSPRYPGVKQGANTFGFPNINDDARLPTAPPDADLDLPTAPPQDKNASGLIYKKGARFYPPKGYVYPDGVVEPGLVTSVAELGFVHTGNSCAFNGGVPWRTLHLQPQPTPQSPDEEYLPDWALLDLFSVPVDPTGQDRSVLRPNDFSSAGKLNLNSRVLPFGNSVFDRLDLLPSIVREVTKDLSGTRLNAGEVSELITNISDHRLSPPNSTMKSAGRNYLDPGFYYSPWQLAEIQGVSDGGEESELVLREIGSLASTRGGTFSIYSVGQAIRQDMSGRITILSEQRNQKIVERMVQQERTPATGTPAKIAARSFYRTASQRKITP